jgi:hypothetical protein
VRNVLRDGRSSAVDRSATVIDTYRVIEKPILATNLTTACPMAASPVKT